jgi:hypothetical protein
MIFKSQFKFQRTIFFASCFVFLVTGAWQRDLKTSSIAALIAAVGTAGTVVLLERDRHQADLREQNTLSQAIDSLRQEKIHLESYVHEAFQVEQELAASVRSLKSERLQLLNRISDLHQQRHHVSVEVKQLQQENKVQTQLREQAEIALADLQFQHQQLQNKIEAHAALDALAPEVRLTRLQNRLAQVRRKLAEQQHQQKLTQTELAIAQEQKTDLEGSLYDLRAEVKVLEQRYTEMQEHLSLSQEQYRDVSFSLLGGQAAVKRLSDEILHKRQEKATLLADIAGLKTLNPLSTDEQVVCLLPTAWQAWLRFVQHLSREEQAFLRIILSRENLVTIPDELPMIMPHAPIETLATILQERATLFLGESPFIRVEDRPLLQLKAEYHSLLSQSPLVPTTDEH